jgi:hypothetical protein
VGSVGSGESDSVEITMSPFPNIQADTVIENYAGIGSNMVESDAENNGAQETITIYTPTPKMDIEISNPTSVCINQNATFTVNLQNA